nr:hypothetical protein [Tanacetum cinerariifolium]
MTRTKPSFSKTVCPTHKEGLGYLFQPMFNEYFNPSPSVPSTIPAVVFLDPVDSTSLPSSTLVDQDASSPKALKESCWIEAMQDDMSSNDLKLGSSFLVQSCHDNHFEVAPRAWYDLLSLFLLSQKFSKGTVDPTLFTRKEGIDILLVRIYVDDIIFAFTDPSLCETFSEIMCLKFKMSMMGKLDPVDTPMVEKSKLDAGPQGKELDPTRYRGMICSLMYLTSNRPDLVFSICMCARYQAKPTKKHLHAVK